MTVPEPLRILFVAANPADSARLAFDHEYAAVESALAGTPMASRIRLEPGLAVDLHRLTGKILETRPTVVHFAGHGVRGGLLLESAELGVGGVVSVDILTGLLRDLGQTVRLVTLNACYSEPLARALTEVVPCAVGMQDAVADAVSIAFARDFYRCLAHGKSIATAFRVGVRAVQHMSAGDAAIPHLAVAEGIDPETFVLDSSEGRGLARPALNMAPRPSEGWVPRPEEHERLMEFLGNEESPALIGLIAAGGYGKTALARAVAHDPRITATHTDGVLWVTLGDAGRPEDGLASIYAALTGERPRFAGLEDARHAVASVIGERHFLLVIDDVWQPAQLRPLLEWGPRVTRLVTTRDRGVLPAKIREHRLGRLEEAQAVALLAQGLPEPMSVAEHKELGSLAHRLGRWPLLLTLVAPLLTACVQYGQTLHEAVADLALQLREDGPEAFSELVGQTIEASLRALPAAAQAHYHTLAVFPEDGPIPLDLLAGLWSVSLASVRRLCLELAQRSLVVHLDLRAGEVGLHDVVRAYLRARLGPERQAIAGRVLATIGVTLDEEPLASVDLRALNDYALDNLVYLLAEADTDAAILSVLTDVAFIQTKVTRRGTLAVLHDLEVAAARASGAESDRLRILARMLRKISHWSSLYPEELPTTLYNALLSGGWSEAEIVRDLRWLGGALPRLRLLHPLQTFDESDQTLAGHGRGVWVCAVSPDLRCLATGDRDGVVKIWDAESGQLAQTLEGHPDDITAIAIDDDLVVSASWDGMVRAWDRATRKERWRLAGRHAGGVLGLAIRRDDGAILTCGRTGEVHRLDPVDGRVLEVIALLGPPRLAAFSGDGRRILAVSGGIDLVFHDLGSAPARRVQTSHEPFITACAIGSGGIALSGDAAGVIHLWDQAGRERGRLHGHEGDLLGLAIADDGRTALSCATDKTLRLWDLETQRELRVLRGHGDWARSCAFIGLHRAVSVSSDRTAKTWDLGRAPARSPRPCHQGRNVTACAITPDGTLAVSGACDTLLMVWDIASGERRQVLRGHAGRVLGCAISDDGARALSVDEHGDLIAWDLKSGQAEHHHSVPGRSCIAATPSCDLAAVGHPAGIDLWAPGEGGSIDVIPLEGGCSHCALSDDGGLVLGGDVGTLCLWDRRARKIRWERSIRGAEFRSVALSPDAKLGLSGSDDYVLRLWDVERGGVLREFRGHRGYITGGTFCADGLLVVSASNDCTIRVWELASGACVGVLCGEHASASVASASGRVVAGDAIGNVWMVDSYSVG